MSDRAPVIPSPLKMHGHLSRHVAGLLPINSLAALAHYQMESRPASLGHALIEDILIERVHEAVARRRRAVRQFDDGRLAQELMSPRQFLAHLLDLHRSF